MVSAGHPRLNPRDKGDAVRTIVRASLLALLAMMPASADAQGDSEFYKGKTIAIVVGFAPGGSYDAYARLLSRHLGKHIPGQPRIIVQNLPGAGSLTGVRHLDTNAPKDGTVIAAFSAGLITESLTDPEKFNFKFTDLAWIGSSTQDFSVCYAWHTAKIKTLADAQKRPSFIIGGTAKGSSGSINSAILSQIFKVNVKSVLGYSGSAESRLAIERGELDGHCGSWVSVPEEWLAQAKATAFVRFSRGRLPEMPADAAFVGDLAQSDHHKRLLEVALAATELGRPYVASRAVPAERVALLRAAFDRAMADPGLLEDAAKLKLPISPIGGADSAAMIAGIYAVPPAIIADLKALLR
jgi:tripartite-type tricarboxylate transporter receptor subunit TctC